MKLTIKVEKWGMKIERTYIIDENTVSNHEAFGKDIEEMYEAIEEKKSDILAMTKHND